MLNNDANTQILKVQNKRESMLKISIQKGKELFLKSVKTTLYVREWETILQIQQKHDLEAYDNTFIFFILDIYILPNAHDEIYSCLENPTDRGAWWAAVHGVAKESDTAELLHFHFSLSCTGEGNGNPLQCSRLENSRDGGAWWAAVYGVAQSWTRLSWLSSSSSSSSIMKLQEQFSICTEILCKLSINQ